MNDGNIIYSYVHVDVLSEQPQFFVAWKRVATKLLEMF